MDEMTAEQAALIEIDSRLSKLESQVKALAAEVRKLMREYYERSEDA